MEQIDSIRPVSASMENFDRVLARHLAVSIAMGAFCDEATVRRCYAETREELMMVPPFGGDLHLEEVEAYFIRHDVDLVEHHRPHMANLPVDVISVLIVELLLDRA